MSRVHNRSPQLLLTVAALLATLLSAVHPDGHKPVPARARQPPTQQTGVEVAQRFQQLTRDSRWRLVETIQLQFDAFHPQGLARVGGRWFLSSVEVLDRAAGKGRGHLFQISADGRRLRTVRLGEGAIYHPGGIDFDGRSLWVPVAEYRPDSQSIIYRVRPRDLMADEVFRYPDHIGALVRDVDGGRLVGVSWGSRRYYAWDLKGDGRAPRDPTRPRQRPNGSHYVDYQDGVSLRGTPFALFGGLAHIALPSKQAPLALGGLELVELRSLRAVHQLPLSLQAAEQRPMTSNPVHVELGPQGSLRFAFAPEDGVGRIYIYEVR